MKIGITCYSTYGGSGVVATELGRCLARRGHEIHFITREIPFRLQHAFEKNIYFHQVDMMEYPLFQKDSPYALALAAKMAEIVRQENLDLLHVHYAIPHAMSAFLAQQMLKPFKLPFVTTLHGTDITLIGQDPAFFDITKFSIEKSTVVTSVSDYLTKKSIETFAVDTKIETVCNFVDTDLFVREKSHCRESMGLGVQQPIYVHLSNFRPVKRSVDVVKIFNRILKRIPQAILIMAGEGPLIPQCRKLVQEYGIQSQVRFVGKQDDIVALLAMSDVMLFPSEEESFGLAAIEAASCCVPVIASRSGGIPEAVLDQKTGMLFDVGDVESMAEAGIKLGLDCKYRNEMGENARKFVIENYTPEIILPKYEYLYQKAIDSM